MTNMAAKQELQKRHQQDTPPMTNTGLKQARIKLIQTEQQQNTINTVKRKEH